MGEGMLAVDVDAVMARLSGDCELLAEIAAVYLEDEPGLLEELRAAVRRGEADAVRRAAHAIKGSVGNFSAGRAHAAAFALEAAGRNGDLSQAGPLLDTLESELAAVRTALQDLVAAPPATGR